MCNGKSLSVFSFYRPPTSGVEYLSQFFTAAKSVQSDYVVLGGDFNLPEIDWHRQPAFPGISGSLNTLMVNFVNLLSLTQMVLEPTRGNHILDIVLTNAPEQVLSTVIMPGISDHQAVLCEMNLKNTNSYNKNCRKIFNYSKANIAEINAALNNYFPTFETLAESHSVNQLWHIFKNKIVDLRNKYVPSWSLTPRQ